jgi:hypothetical protein
VLATNEALAELDADTAAATVAFFNQVMPDEFAEFAADFGCTESVDVATGLSWGVLPTVQLLLKRWATNVWAS